MIDLGQPRPPGSAALLVRVGDEHGVPAETCLAGTGFTADQLADPEQLVPAGVELDVVRNLQAALPDVPALGLEAGRQYHLTTHGTWGFALASCRNGWAALDLGLEFLELTWAFCEIRAEVRDGRGRLVFDDHAVPADVRTFLVQRELASVVTIAREVSGRFGEPAPTQLRQPPPVALTPFTDFLGVPPVFGAAANHVEVPAAMLDDPLPQADAHTAALTRAQCRRLLDEWRARTGLAGTVRRLLAESPGHVPGIEEVADRLHVSSRTLRRRLDREGTTFRRLVDEVRRRLAEDLLTAGELSVEQIAHRLGYQAAPAFSAAFTRWTGASPRRYRRGRAGVAARPGGLT